MVRTKPGPNASSSDDLARAKAASQRLRGETTTRSAEPGYVAFPHARPAPPARPATHPLVTRREPLKGPTAGFGSAAWNKLLDACLQTAAAEAAFLMDPHGLIIASRGARPGEELEAIGARLMVALEQADRIAGEPALSMSVELPKGTLHGLRLVQPDGVLMLGLSIPGGLTADRLSRLMSLLAAAE
jgi:hypothetical protein